MNEVEETLRVLKDSIEFHKLQLKKLYDANDSLSESDLPVIHKITIRHCIKFNCQYHNHKLEENMEAREEIMKKYKIGE